MIRVFVVDDHGVVRDGLRFAFARAGDIEIAGEAASAVEALQRLRAEAFKYDLLLLDLSLPDQSGLALLADIKREAPALPVLFLSSFAEDQYARQVLAEGASGYVAKGAGAQTIGNAVRVVANGGTYLSASTLRALSAQGRKGTGGVAQLSAREREILILLASGKGLTEIGESLQLSVKTVSTYRTRILEKTGLSNNAELTRYALDRGLIS